MPLVTFKEICLPYCLERQPDGLWMVLNREYLPLGFSKRDQDAIDKAPVRYDFKGIGPDGLKKIAHHASGRWIFLYDGTCDPEDSKENWNRYQERLWGLRKFEIRGQR